MDVQPLDTLPYLILVQLMSFLDKRTLLISRFWSHSWLYILNLSHQISANKCELTKRNYKFVLNSDLKVVKLLVRDFLKTSRPLRVNGELLGNVDEIKFGRKVCIFNMNFILGVAKRLKKLTFKNADQITLHAFVKYPNQFPCVAVLDLRLGFQNFEVNFLRGLSEGEIQFPALKTLKFDWSKMPQSTWPCSPFSDSRIRMIIIYLFKAVHTFRATLQEIQFRFDRMVLNPSRAVFQPMNITEQNELDLYMETRNLISEVTNLQEITLVWACEGEISRVLMHRLLTAQRTLKRLYLYLTWKEWETGNILPRNLIEQICLVNHSSMETLDVFTLDDIQMDFTSLRECTQLNRLRWEGDSFIHESVQFLPRELKSLTICLDRGSIQDNIQTLQWIIQNLTQLEMLEIHDEIYDVDLLVFTLESFMAMINGLRELTTLKVHLYKMNEAVDIDVQKFLNKCRGKQGIKVQMLMKEEIVCTVLHFEINRRIFGQFFLE